MKWIEKESIWNLVYRGDGDYFYPHSPGCGRGCKILR